MQQIWGGRAAGPRGWRAFVRARLISFGFILAIGFLLLVSLTLTTALAALRGYVVRHFEGLVGVFASIDFLLSIALGTGLVAMIYRYLPAKRLPWRQVFTGALVTALLFHLGRWAIGLYLGRATQPTAYGAAASFAALLLWLYYSAQIFLFGAEFTACLGRTRKRREPLSRLLSLDGELAEGDAEIPAIAGARKRQGDFTLGDHLRLGGFHRTGMRLGAGVAAEYSSMLLHAGEFAGAITNGGFAGGEAAAARREFHRHRLAVVAGDRARAIGTLVEYRPATHRELDFAIDLGGLCRAPEVEGTDEARTEKKRMILFMARR